MKLTLRQKRKEVPDCLTFIFEMEQNFIWQAGQYLRYKIANQNADGRKDSRFFTIASAPNEKQIQLTTRFAEKSSTFKKDLQKLNIGDTIEAFGPMGDFILENPQGGYVFLAGGIGITPFRSILKQLDYEKTPFDITLLYANRDENIVFKNELEEIASRNTKFKIHYIIDPERIDETVIKNLGSIYQALIYYISGPEPMVEVLKQLLIKMDVSEEKIKTDFFPGYTKI